MIKISKQNNLLLLIYQPDRFNDTRWLDNKLQQGSSITLRRTFTFTPDDLLPHQTLTDEENDGERIFVLGILENSYYTISKEVLGLKHNLMLDSAMKLGPETFTAQRDISVFRRINELIDEPIIVGGVNEVSIPRIDFEQLLKTFPTSTELTHYSRTRVTRILKDYFGTMSDAEAQLNRYLNRKKRLPVQSRDNIIANFELQKFKYIHSELQEMLACSDSYTEKDWQKKILDLLLFIFPKYIAVLENVHVKDFYSTPNRTSKRFIDLMLADANGNIDIIEIKKPIENALLSRNKYRDNYTPHTDLAGAIMQAEKYLFHLSKWGKAGEKEIYDKHKDKLPDGIILQITNPKALILLGRNNGFTGEQRFDFEIIRRKYANMIDIMAYDDLLRRLENIINMMERQVSKAPNTVTQKGITTGVKK